ncbi:MAG: PAS domain S-box protein [Hydrogenovibrio crunogenus]|uniref:histidine kinase n=1 Tax=Hydrogenovibrio crunogenus (strain DSM 25203 / XCL-2) TaxID=317025 RepID=Q31GT7_HYDCU|nr:PAS domain S-box protein [Hydrogenovibrio crunogenus]
MSFSQQNVLALTKEPYFLTYFEQNNSDNLTVCDNLSDLVDRVKSAADDKHPYHFVFMDESMLSKSDVESILNQLHKINSALFYLISCTDLNEEWLNKLQKTTRNQVIFVDEKPAYALLKQAEMQIVRLADLQLTIVKKSDQFKTVQQKLAVRDKLFNNLLSVIKFDSEGNIISINPHGTTEMGWRNAEVLGMSIHDIVLWSNDGSGIVQYFETFSGETRYFDNEGKQRWAFAQVKKVKEHNRNYFYFIGKDITEQKQFARRLQYENYQEGILKAKSDLIHDIGNTLNSMNATYGVLASGVEQLKGVANYIERWCEEKQSLSLPVETSYHFIEAIENSCHFILDKHFSKTTLALKNDLALLIDAVGTKQQILPVENAKEVINVYNLIQEVILSSQALLNEKQISIQLLDANPSIFLKLSHNQLFQALLNLIKNAVEAIEASDKTTRQITLQACQTEEAILLMVQDSGKGVESLDLKKIFNYGYTTKEGGSGHGLHSVANFMNKNGGKVEVASSKEGGARFTLTFPISLSEI